MNMSLAERLANTRMTPGKIGAKRFRAGTTSATTVGERSRLARIEAPAARGLLEGPKNPFKIALPAYESFTTDATAGNTETFTLANNLIKSPNTNNVVLYEAGSRVQPAAVDYTNDAFDYTDDGTGNTLHVFYTTDAAGEVELVKRAPDGRSSSEVTLDSAALHHIAHQDQTDQPHYLSFSKDADGWVPTDFALEIYVNAEYQVALEDPNGDGATADNALFQLPAVKASEQIPGLPSAVRAAMR